MTEKALRAARVVSVIAATLIALACGTNYVYSAWAPQFAERLRLSTTESNLIGVFGNLGMYGTGIPVGLLIDSKGPRPGVLIGALALGSGYFLIYNAHKKGPGSMGVPLICFFSFLTGMGSCSAFSAAIKTSALNFPNHRGTATAFPLAAFGLSAFFFSIISSFAFPDNTSDFLLLLAAGTSGMAFISMLFLRVVPHTSSYSKVPNHERRDRSDSNELYRTKSRESRYSGEYLSEEPGRPSVVANSLEADTQHDKIRKDRAVPHESIKVSGMDTDETCSLISKSSVENVGDCSNGAENFTAPDSHGLDIRGLALLPKVEFWQLFAMLGLLTGIGLMTINNIGNDAQALWSHYDDSVPPSFIQERQLMHVSILSIFSFSGRLLSGVGSDLIVKKLGMSRFWCLFVSSVVFCGAQVCGARIENPHLLGFVSALTGLAYGFLFGVYPSLVAEAFGVHGLSQNWGCMIFAPVIAGNIFNLLYGTLSNPSLSKEYADVTGGTIYDHHSTILPDGERDCPEGLKCYRTAYWVTFVASLAGMGVTLWAIRHEHAGKARSRKAERERIGARDA